MKDLKTILTEGFFKNVGAVYSIADVITKGKGSIKLYGRDITEVPIRNKSVAITRTGPESIHVVTKDRYYSKKEFDISFSDYRDTLYSMAQGDFKKLTCAWYSNVGHYDGFTLRFINKDTQAVFWLEYIVHLGGLFHFDY